MTKRSHQHIKSQGTATSKEEESNRKLKEKKENKYSVQEWPYMRARVAFGNTHVGSSSVVEVHWPVD